jgi:hypothetical protein
MSPALSVVPTEHPPAPKPETVGERVRRLQNEARAAADAHSRELVDALQQLEALAAEIAVMGQPYLPGVVNEARLLVEESAQRVERLGAILARAPR